jgi:hypothetical protein
MLTIPTIRIIFTIFVALHVRHTKKNGVMFLGITTNTTRPLTLESAEGQDCCPLVQQESPLSVMQLNERRWSLTQPEKGK